MRRLTEDARELTTEMRPRKAGRTTVQRRRRSFAEAVDLAFHNGDAHLLIH